MACRNWFEWVQNEALPGFQYVELGFLSSIDGARLDHRIGTGCNGFDRLSMD